MRSRELYVPVHLDLPGHRKTLRVSRLLGIPPAHVVGYLVTLWSWALVHEPLGDVTDYEPEELAFRATWAGDAIAFVDALSCCGKKDEPGFLERTSDGRLLIHDLPLYLRPLLAKRTSDAERMREKRAQEKRAAEEAARAGQPPGDPPRPTPAPPQGGGEGRQITPGRGQASAEAPDPEQGVDVERPSYDRRTTVAGLSLDREEEKRGEKRDTRERGVPSPPDGGTHRALGGGIPSSLEAVRAYWAEAGLLGDPEAFFDHFTSNGWKVGGKAPMKDWQSGARNWSRNERSRPGAPSSTATPVKTHFNRPMPTRDQYLPKAKESKA